MNTKITPFAKDSLNGAWKIFSGAIGTGIFSAYQHGEIANWRGFGHVLSDAALPAVVLTIVWLCVRSPKDNAQMAALQTELDRLKAGK